MILNNVTFSMYKVNFKLTIFGVKTENMFFRKEVLFKSFSLQPSRFRFIKDCENVQKKKLETNNTKQSSEKHI